MSDPQTKAVADHVRSLLPTLDEMFAHQPMHPKDMGPDITLPAVWVHIILARLGYLELVERHRDIQRRWARECSSSGVPLTVVRGVRAHARGAQERPSPSQSPERGYQLSCSAIRTTGGDGTGGCRHLLTFGVSNPLLSILRNNRPPRKYAAYTCAGASDHHHEQERRSVTNEQSQFESDHALLAAGNDLALLAVELVGKDDAAAALLGAALKVWQAEFGYDGAMGAARAALESIVGNQDRLTRAN